MIGKNCVVWGHIALYALITGLFGGVFLSNAKAQIDPLNSPYFDEGPYQTVSDSDTTHSPVVYSFRPDTAMNAPYPVLIFQLGANGFGEDYIGPHSYDIYLEHLASYGYVTIVVNDADAGLPNGSSFTDVHDWFKAKSSDSTHWASELADTNRVYAGGHSNGGVNATSTLLDRPDDFQGIVYFASYPSDNALVPHDVSNYDGNVLSLAGEEDETSTPQDCKDGYDKYKNSNCKYYTLFAGTAHGAFGDYDNPDQPVGSISRDSATAQIRHFLVSFLQHHTKGNADAELDLKDPDRQPGTTKQFETTCSLCPAGSDIDSILVDEAVCGDSTGRIVIRPAMKGTFPYQYSIDSGQTYKGDSIFSELPAGDYDIAIKDANNCRTDTSISVSNIPGPRIDSVSNTPASCDTTDGALTIYASGGSGELSFSKDSGATFVADSVFKGLTPGFYHVAVRDSNGCRSDSVVTIENRSVSIDSVTSNLTSCDTTNGTITIHASGETGPFQYSIDSGDTFDTDSQFTGLSKGTYTIVVEDSNGCQAFDKTTLTHPEAPGIDSVTVKDADCGMDNGTIRVSATGGSGAISYSIDGGSSYKDSNAFNGVSPGKHSVVVTDTAGCSDSITTTVGEETEPLAMAQADADTIDLAMDSTVNFSAQGSQGNAHIWDFGDGDSAFTANASHTYTSPGSYTVILTVEKGDCTARDTLTVEVMKSTGMEESRKTKEEKLSLYPNPTDGDLTVHFEEGGKQGTIRIRDISGRLVLEKALTGKARVKIDASGLEKGIYMVEFNALDGGQSVKRLVVGN